MDKFTIETLNEIRGALNKTCNLKGTLVLKVQLNFYTVSSATVIIHRNDSDEHIIEILDDIDQKYGIMGRSHAFREGLGYMMTIYGERVNTNDSESKYPPYPVFKCYRHRCADDAILFSFTKENCKYPGELQTFCIAIDKNNLKDIIEEIMPAENGEYKEKKYDANPTMADKIDISNAEKIMNDIIKNKGE